MHQALTHFIQSSVTKIPVNKVKSKTAKSLRKPKLSKVAISPTVTGAVDDMGSFLGKATTDPPASQISGIVKSKDIVIFQSSTCPYCVEAVKVLKENGYDPLVINASQDQRQVVV